MNLKCTWCGSKTWYIASLKVNECISRWPQWTQNCSCTFIHEPIRAHDKIITIRNGYQLHKTLLLILMDNNAKITPHSRVPFLCNLVHQLWEREKKKGAGHFFQSLSLDISSAPNPFCFEWSQVQGYVIWTAFLPWETTKNDNIVNQTRQISFKTKI